jgi:hypothetical protein
MTRRSYREVFMRFWNEWSNAGRTVSTHSQIQKLKENQNPSDVLQVTVLDSKQQHSCQCFKYSTHKA